MIDSTYDKISLLCLPPDKISVFLVWIVSQSIPTVIHLNCIVRDKASLYCQSIMTKLDPEVDKIMLSHGNQAKVREGRTGVSQTTSERDIIDG